MEDVLETYKRPYNPKKPLVGFDESNKQQIQDLVEPMPTKEGKPKRVESTYKRNGTSNLFMFFEPLAGKRRIKVTKRKTKKDFAECMKELVDEMYPDAEKIVLIMDNLKTHNLGSLYETFHPKEAKHIADKLEIH
jgi:DDE superfamily endonuclease